MFNTLLSFLTSPFRFKLHNTHIIRAYFVSKPRIFLFDILVLRIFEVISLLGIISRCIAGAFIFIRTIMNELRSHFFLSNKWLMHVYNCILPTGIQSNDEKL